jgi:ectoine hydroxylase-related dioxygenase (phytanoyl-CoA dioxygenase family)
MPPEQIARFEKDGVMLLKGVINETWVKTLRRMVDQNIAEPGPHMERLGAQSNVFDDYNMWQHINDARAWETTGPYPAIAAQLMRSTQVNLFMDQLIVKYPGGTETTPWHQDTAYMGVNGRNFLTFWTTTRAMPEELTVEYVRGSHSWGTVFAPFVDGPITVGEIPSDAARQRAIELKDGSTRQGTSDLPIPDIEGHRDDYDIVSFDVEPGDAIVFYANICHKGQGNTAEATEPRVSVIARYCGGDATYAIRTPAAEFPINPPADSVHGTPLRDYAENFPKVWPVAA